MNLLDVNLDCLQQDYIADAALEDGDNVGDCCNGFGGGNAGGGGGGGDGQCSGRGESGDVFDGGNCVIGIW